MYAETTRTINPPTVAAPEKPTVFYRPELDVLRFIAFASVLMTHGPKVIPNSRINSLIFIAQTACTSGLCLFFLLSAFLITELLLRERDATCSINLKNFYIRRTLRIWPLYYLGVAIAVILGATNPEFHLNKHEIVYLVTFLGWLGVPFHSNPMGLLWSISLEEMFYLVWPSVIAWRGTRSVLGVSLLIIPGSLLYVTDMDRYWFSPTLQFLYFAAGALMAVYMHRKPYAPSPLARFGWLLLWMAAWYIRGSHLLVNSSWPRYAALESAVVGVGCAALFLSIYRITVKNWWFTRWIIRLGKISYGLYVFHMCFLVLVFRYLNPFLAEHNRVRVLVIDGVAFTITWFVASLSFRFYEEPFLKLKKRFELVKH